MNKAKTSTRREFFAGLAATGSALVGGAAAVAQPTVITKAPNLQQGKGPSLLGERSTYESPQRFQNTYCARCHSPFQADPEATYGTSELVAEADWQAVTCGSCHPPHSLRVAWGTPIGNFDVDASTPENPVWVPVFEEEADES